MITMDARASLLTKVIMQCLIGVGKVVIVSLLLSLVLSPVLGLINELRNYGLPADVTSVAQTPIYVHSSKSAIAAFLDWYNSSMSGYARFGSGIGMISGAFWAMGGAKTFAGPARFLTGLTAGFLIGSRLALMITSDPPIVIGAAAIAGLWTAIYLFFSGRPSQFKPLPRLNLWSHN
jgi:hypothetical protein